MTGTATYDRRIRRRHSDCSPNNEHNVMVTFSAPDMFTPLWIEKHNDPIIWVLALAG
jgi:hypothetical protein